MKTKDLMVLGSILMLILCSVANVSADSGAAPNSAPILTGHQQDLVNRHLVNLTKMLGLSTEQQAEIKPILLDQEAKRKDFAASRAKIQELQDATDSLIQPILTAAQLTTYNAMSERHKMRPDR
jgi:hypothetical protein